tara:strand:+ start:2594 stop:3871 length:1278 start_codon:yes stop_codon:yes gene_type:complete
MKIITLIYIFSLYVLLSPGVFNKTSLTFENCLLFSLLFSIIFFFTINLVDKNLENYEQQVSLQMNGLDNLVDLIKMRQKNNEMNIDIENQIKGAEDDGAKCWNALGKTQKDIEVLRLQLDSYEGNWETIQKLNQTIIDYQNKIATLKTQVGAYENDKDQVNQLMVYLTRYQKQLSALQKQVAAFTNSDGDLTNLQGQYNNMVKEKNQLLLDYSESDKLTPGLASDITTYNNTISKNNDKITNLQRAYSNDRDTIMGIERAIKDNDNTLNDLQNIYKNTKTSCPRPSIWFYNPTKAKQLDHQNTAKAYGGNLASFSSAEELNSVLGKFDNKDSCWIGGKRKRNNLPSFLKHLKNRRNGNLTWEWFDGSTWKYTNWHNGEPNSHKEKGVQLYSDGTWNDLPQDAELAGLYKLTTPKFSIPGLKKIIV